MLDIHWLHTFVTLARLQHFGQTATELHMTQPNVSLHLKNLEQALGTALFERTPRGMDLTPAGDAVLLWQSKAPLGIAVRYTVQIANSGPGEVRVAGAGNGGLDRGDGARGACRIGAAWRDGDGMAERDHRQARVDLHAGDRVARAGAEECLFEVRMRDALGRAGEARAELHAATEVGLPAQHRGLRAHHPPLLTA